MICKPFVVVIQKAWWRLYEAAYKWRHTNKRSVWRQSQEEFEDTKGVIRIRKLKKDGQNITQKTKDWATRTLLKTGGELRCFGRVCSSSTTNGTCCVTLGTNPVIINEWGKDQEVLVTSRTHPWSFMPHIFRNGYPAYCGDRNTFKGKRVYLRKTLPDIFSIKTFLEIDDQTMHSSINVVWFFKTFMTCWDTSKVKMTAGMMI